MTRRSYRSQSQEAQEGTIFTVPSGRSATKLPHVGQLHMLELPMSESEVKERLERAIQKLCALDGYLLAVGINERSITHRLAMYLQEEFLEMDVDCEYNRNHDLKKTLRDYPETVRSDDTTARTVFPDIIVHKRGTSLNLLLIEAKKDDNRDEETDRVKLRAFKTDPKLGYRYCVFLKIRTGTQNPGVYPPEFL